MTAGLRLLSVRPAYAPLPEGSPVHIVHRASCGRALGGSRCTCTPRVYVNGARVKVVPTA